MGQKRPQKTRRLKVPKLEVETSRKEKDRECSVILTEKEIAALFLGELATGRSSIPSEEQSDRKPSASPDDSTAQAIPSKKGKRQKKRKNAVAGPSTSSSLTKETPVKAVPTQATKLKTTDMIVPLEEGEEDPSVSAEVLRQTAAFLARLTPSRSHKFWALRQVARGEKTHQSITKETENLSTDNEEEEEDEEEVTSSDDLDDETSRGVVVEEEDTEPAVKHGKGNKMKRKRGGGGSLFNSNPDVWDD
ncbi:hypothetical protein LSM04_002182 [Trypanosoma melophagium]|uniref:uncharacterized protein n=1 Tax=Trypanosoma melophagium TaxID=715481 RepID=UPI003519DF1F|nr:hypothetical protein LSM04_002182 [Trypanosoma melophagium]